MSSFRRPTTKQSRGERDKGKDETNVEHNPSQGGAADADPAGFISISTANAICVSLLVPTLLFIE